MAEAANGAYRRSIRHKCLRFRIGDVLRFGNRERSSRIETALYGSRQGPASSVCTDQSASKLARDKGTQATSRPAFSWIAMEPYGLNLVAALSYFCHAVNPSSRSAKLANGYQPVTHACMRAPMARFGFRTTKDFAV